MLCVLDEMDQEQPPKQLEIGDYKDYLIWKLCKKLKGFLKKNEEFSSTKQNAYSKGKANDISIPKSPLFQEFSKDVFNIRGKIERSLSHIESQLELDIYKKDDNRKKLKFENKKHKAEISEGKTQKNGSDEKSEKKNEILKDIITNELSLSLSKSAEENEPYAKSNNESQSGIGQLELEIPNFQKDIENKKHSCDPSDNKIEKPENLPILTNVHQENKNLSSVSNLSKQYEEKEASQNKEVSNVRQIDNHYEEKEVCHNPNNDKNVKYNEKSERREELNLQKPGKDEDSHTLDDILKENQRQTEFDSLVSKYAKAYQNPNDNFLPNKIGKVDQESQTLNPNDKKLYQEPVPTIRYPSEVLASSLQKVKKHQIYYERFSEDNDNLLKAMNSLENNRKILEEKTTKSNYNYKDRLENSEINRDFNDLTIMKRENNIYEEKFVKTPPGLNLNINEELIEEISIIMKTNKKEDIMGRIRNLGYLEKIEQRYLEIIELIINLIPELNIRSHIVSLFHFIKRK